MKSPFRDNQDCQSRAIRQSTKEIGLLHEMLHGVPGIRQLLDTILLRDVHCGVFEYLDVDLHRFHSISKRKFSQPQLKELVRQILSAIVELHARDIVHAGISASYACLPRTEKSDRPQAGKHSIQ